MNELKEKLAGLDGNQEFAKALETAKNVEDLVRIFAEYGVETTEKELRELGASDKEGELSAEDLEDVAGGAVNWRRILRSVRDILIQSAQPIGWNW